MSRLNHTLRLGLKELTSLRHDSVLLLFLLYAFSVAIYMPAAGSVIGVHNASVAVVDEDHSLLSRKLTESLQPPEFQPAVPLPPDRLDQAMDSGQYTFVINVPVNFQSDLLAGRSPELQINVDATAMSQAFMGAGYIGRIFERELLDYTQRTTTQSPVLNGSAGLAPDQEPITSSLGTPVQMTVKAVRGPSDVLVRDRSGAILWTGHLTQGGHRQLFGTGPFTVRAVHPAAVDVWVAGKPRGPVGDGDHAASRSFR